MSKSVLGREPEVFGEKDAVHVPIVSVRAGQYLIPGLPCSLDGRGEAQLNKINPIGIIDPFRQSDIEKGQLCWLLLYPHIVIDVKHTWKMAEEQEFEEDTADDDVYSEDNLMLGTATRLNLSVTALMEAMRRAFGGDPIEYVGNQRLIDNLPSRDLWDKWCELTGNELDDDGDYCCPDTIYPEKIFQ